MIRSLRVVLDTNIFISALMFPASVLNLILELCLAEKITLVLSPYILEELARVLPRMKRLPLTQEDIGITLQRLALIAEIVEPIDVSDIDLRDPADRPILGTLLASGADYLITGDKDLLALAGKYPILTPAQFWQRHGEPAS